MKFSQIFSSDKVAISFELFPPKTERGEQQLFEHVDELMRFAPAFVTCTYGAGGSTRAKTLDVVEQVKNRFGATVAAHLTCVGSTLEQLRDCLHDASARGVQNIVALRGDPPQGETAFRAVEGGLRYANELVAMIASEFPEFGVAVAGYPEKHREAPDMQVDLENLRRKVDAGADVVITQLFYDNDDFFRFRDDCAKVGIRTPIVPGVLPVTNFAQIQRITSLCGAKLPKSLVDPLARLENDADGQFDVGVQFAVDQVQALLDAGVPGVHFYVLNKSQATKRVLQTVSLPT